MLSIWQCLAIMHLTFDGAWTHGSYDQLYGYRQFWNLLCMVCSSPHELLQIPTVSRIMVLYMAQWWRESVWVRIAHNYTRMVLFFILYFLWFNRYIRTWFFSDVSSALSHLYSQCRIGRLSLISSIFLNTFIVSCSDLRALSVVHYRFYIGRWQIGPNDWTDRRGCRRIS